MIENLFDSLMRTLENASGRSIGMVMALIGIVVWWIVSRVKSVLKRLKGEDIVSRPEQKGQERPRRRLSLRVYHR